MTVTDHTSCPDDCSKIERHAAHPRKLAPNLLKLLAASCVVALAGCAQNPPPHAAAALSALSALKTPSASVAQPVRRRTEPRDLQARIRKLDPTLLAPRPAPNCDYKRTDLKTVDQDEWARLKTEYELHCYRETEEATRTRLGLLQSSIRHLQR
jgi:hypothetical protein